MQQHAHVVRRAADDSGDVSRRQILDLTQLKDLTLLSGKPRETVAQGLSRFSRFHEPISVDRRPKPGTIRVEALLEGLLQSIRRILARVRAPALLGLVVKDAKQPCADCRATLETVERLQKRQKYLLCQILGVARREAQATRRSKDPASLLVDHFANSCGIASTQALEQVSFSKRHVLS